MEEVILVNSKDQLIGMAPKIEAHEKGLLHRAFSIFIFNSKGEFLLQQRALNKYHSGGLWTNTCCSHPRLGELTLCAAKRRLEEEMGMFCTLEKVFDFIYKSPVGNGLIEHEFDHVYFGQSDSQPIINKEEVLSWRYFTINEIENELASSPEKFTEWFKRCFYEVKNYINEKEGKYLLV